MTHRALLILLGLLLMSTLVLGVELNRNYDQDMAKVQQLNREGRYDASEKLLTILNNRFPHNHEIIATQGRLRLWQKDYAAAAKLLQASLSIQENQDVRNELIRAESLAALTEAERLIAAGEPSSALPLLEELFNEKRILSESGLRLGRLYLETGEADKARNVFVILRNTFPADADFALLAIRALINQKRPQEALSELSDLPPSWQSRSDAVLLKARLLIESGDLTAARAALTAARDNHDPEVERQRARLDSAILLKNADEAILAGRDNDAEQLLLPHFDKPEGRYEAGLRLGRLYLARKEYVKAAEIYRQLREAYPDERDFNRLYLEALAANDQNNEVLTELDQQSEKLDPALLALRTRLRYQARPNNLKVSGGLYRYSKGRAAEESFGATLTQKHGDYTSVLTAAFVHRFGLSDTQAGLELHRHLGKDSSRYGYLALTVSPDASFLPRYTVGGEVTQGVKGLDLSLGLFRLDFQNSAAHILVPGVVWYLPRGFALGERLYMVLDTGGFTGLTTLYWQPDNRFKASYSLGIGTATEKISAAEDTRKISTQTNRLTAEYRMLESISIGFEASSEHRKTLYDRTGIMLFGRYWW